MSPIDRDMPGIKGKRRLDKPGRFDPSEPLHMTTRRAAKTGTVNGSPSINGSITDSASRRGSLDDQRPVTSHSNGSQFSTKSRRVSDISITQVTPDSHMNGLHSSEEKLIGRSRSKQLSPVQQSPSPSRKRKRSSSSTSTSPPSPTPQQPNSDVLASFESYNGIDEYYNEYDAVDLVPEDDLSDREAPPSQASSQSEGMVEGNETMGAPSMDITPAVSEPASPVTSESNSQEDLPLAKPLGAALEEFANAAQDEQDDADDQDDTVDAVEDVDDAEDIDDQVRSDDEGRPRKGRFGGRRRAKHPIPRVEKAMQRQAELKSAYRAIARAQKAVLAEIAQRTIDDLETNPELHLQSIEYDGVRARLDSAYDERRDHLNAQLRLNTVQLAQTRDAEDQMLQTKFDQYIEDLYEAQLAHFEHEIIKITREAQLDEIDGQYETEDEDDVIPRPKGMAYRWRRTNALDSVYDSRSQPLLETERATADLERRFAMGDLLASLQEHDKPKELRKFTIMDSARRDMAVERRQGVKSINTLAEAAAEIERISMIPVIRNEDALGLQLLGDLASRPSIASIAPPSVLPKASRDSLVGNTPSRRVPPPPLQLHTNYVPGQIPLQMSPKTTHAVGDRFDSSMPPPMTPRQPTTPYIRSPEAMRGEFPASSPTRNISRVDGVQQSPVKHAGSRPSSQSGPHTDFVGARGDHTQPQEQHPERRREGYTAPFRAEDNDIDHPRWRDYSHQPLAGSRRMSNNSERPLFSFYGSPPRRDETQHSPDQRLEGKRETQEAIKNESSPFNPLQRRPPQWPEASSNQGAPDVRSHDAASTSNDPRRFNMNMPRSPRSRPASMTFSVHDFRHDKQLTDHQIRQRSGSMKSTFHHKSNKAERGGLPRRHWSNGIPKKLKGSFDRSQPARSPPPVSSSYAGSSAERAPLAAPWHAVSQNSPIGPPPPTATYHHNSPYAPPSQAHYPPSQQGYDYYPHRHSLGPLPPPPVPAPASVWDQPSPLYAVPQSQQHPPPPGVPPEQHNRFGPLPPPGGYQFPPPPLHTPQTPHPLSAPGTYGQQFGGPPLAPATTTPGYHPGFRPHPPPAFAQQAQQQQFNFGPRRRTQSDANPPKFHQWAPPHVNRR